MNDFYNTEKTALPAGLKIVAAIISIAFTLLLVSDALNRILVGLNSSIGMNESQVEQAARLTSMIVFCGLATSIIRLIAGGFPIQSAARLAFTLGTFVVSVVLLIWIAKGLAAPAIPATTIVYSVCLVAVPIAEDAIVLWIKNNERRRVPA